MQDLNRVIHYAPEMFTHHDPLSIISEAFKIVRTNIEFSSIDNKLQTINITSSNKSEGKSSVLTNLAITFAQIGRKVLLIDADLRRPMVHRLLGLSNRRGLTNALLSNEPYTSFVQATQSPNLFVLTAGPVPPNPAELLMSTTMNHLIESVKSEYDLILFDTPPVGMVTDAAILATKVDGTLFVVRSGLVDKRQLKRASDLLKQVKANVLGFVFNGVQQDTDDYYYYYYYQSEQAAEKRTKAKRNKNAPRQQQVTPPQPVRPTQRIPGKGGSNVEYD